MGISLVIVVWLVAAGGQERELVRPLAAASDATALKEGASPPKGWTMRVSSDWPEVGLERVREDGGTVRITATGGTTLYRPAFSLAGDGSVSATFLVGEGTAGVYGLTLGDEDGMAFVLRSDGAVGTASCESGTLSEVTWWTAAAPEKADAGRHLEVRVRAPVAEIVVNGKVRASVSLPVGALDGVPGVYTDGQSELRVAGFRVSRGGTSPYASAIR